MSELNVNWPPAGRYILAVSGGADSMVLLDLFARAAASRGYDLLVAHFDHGLRPESADDAVFVAAAARAYGLPFESANVALESRSEAAARHARHTWLEKVRAAHHAQAIITAHHQDDLLETSLLNLARGTGRLGLAPMQSGGLIIRPLLELTRVDLRQYAKANEITWREDPTNADISNARNLVRHRLLASATPDWRARYLERIQALTDLNRQIAQHIETILNDARQPDGSFVFIQDYFSGLSETEAAEILLAAARRLRPGLQLDSPLVKKAAEFARTGAPHKWLPLRQELIIRIENHQVRLATNSLH